MTQPEINLATFTSAIWGVAVLGGILFATLKKSAYYRVGIGIGMGGMLTGALMIFRSELFPYAGLVRISAIDVMLTLVLISYYLGVNDRIEQKTRTTIIWVVIGIEVLGLIAVPFVQLLDQIDVGALRAVRTERAAKRAESEVGRLQAQYTKQHKADSIQHSSDSIQIQQLKRQVTEQTAILRYNQGLMKNMTVLYQSLLLEIQKMRYDGRRRYSDATPEPLEPKPFPVAIWPTDSTGATLSLSRRGVRR